MKKGITIAMLALYIMSSSIMIGSNIAGDVVNKLGSSSFWKGLGRSFGAAPTGYVYSAKIYNDLQEPINVTTKEYASFMGGMFPKSGGVTTVSVDPFKSFSINQKEYYFDLVISQQGQSIGSMPYSTSGSLYVQPCTQINPKDKHSTKVHYFHTYIGKTLSNGSYTHGPRAESLGYADPGNAKDANAIIEMTDAYNSVVFYNNTNEDVILGMSSKAGASSLQKSDCDHFYTLVAHNSFASYTPKNSFNPATVGIFSSTSTTSSELFVLPSSVFKGKTYTLEIYQDAGQSRKIGLQGLGIGNYDMPTGRVRDITPITGQFWYQSVKQAGANTSSYVDLEGQVWIAAQTKDGTIIQQVPVGTSLEFQLYRPYIDTEQLLYFLYVATSDTKKAEQFVENVVSGKIGGSTISSYQTGSKKQLEASRASRQGTVTTTSSGTNNVSQSLLTQTLSGALALNKGEISDATTGVTGYLLGADFILPQGVGASSLFYYTLAPSNKLANQIPTSPVQNVYAYSLGGSSAAPKGMPAIQKKISANGTVSTVSSGA